jgi:hypothetical protein
MLKKIGFPLLALAALLFAIPQPQASAAVRFGVYVGGPAYAYQAPVYPPPYAPHYYNEYPTYSYPAPAYVYPYSTWRGHEDRDHREYRGNEYRGHNDRDRHEDRGRGRR